MLIFWSTKSMGIQGKRPTKIFIKKTNLQSRQRFLISCSYQSLTADSEVLNHGGSKNVLWFLRCIPTGTISKLLWWHEEVHWLQGNSARVFGLFFCVNHWRLLPMLPHLCQQMLQTGLEMMSLELCKKGCLWCIATEQNFDKMS